MLMNHTFSRSFVPVNWLLAASVALAGCGGGSTGSMGSPTVQTFDFDGGTLGWTSDVSDLPANYDNATYEISFAHASLPAPLGTSRKALRLTSHNRSDDLWQFVKRRISGLQPNTSYQVRFEVELASNAPENSAGVGGSPGSSVFVKVGASPQEPTVTVNGGGRVFSLDKGNNANGGTQATVIGNVGIAGDEFVYKLKSLGNASRPFPVRTDNQGQVWVFVGTDSGFEGQQTLYYTQIKLTFSPS